jgi:hypothetical protein
MLTSALRTMEPERFNTMPLPRRVLPVFLSICASLALLAAAPQAHALDPKADVFLGYSRLGANAFYPNVGGLNGWNGAMNVKVKPLLGVEGDVSQYGFGASSTVPHTTAVLFGPRVTVGAAGVNVFVHALGGLEHSANSSGVSISGTSMAYAAGVGLDLPLAPYLKWRIMGDYFGSPTLTPASSSHYRVSVGLAVRF